MHADDAGVAVAAAPTASLPVARSRSALTLFLVTALITVAILFWMVSVRSGSGLMVPAAPIFLYLLFSLDYIAAMCALLIVVIAVLVPGTLPFQAWLRWLGSRPMLVSAVVTVMLCLGTLTVYHNFPLSMDEYAPLFQSKVFASGHLTGHFPPELLDWLIVSGFQNYFLHVSRLTGEVASSYWPGHALLMTPFTLLGIPWALNPVLSGLSLIVMHRLALHLFKDVEAAGLVLLLTIASPVFLANGISYYSMTAHALATVVYAWLLLGGPLTPKRLVLAGLVGSLALTLHNPVPHLLIAIPFGLWVISRENGVRNALWMLAGYLPLCLVLGVGWFFFIDGLAQQGTQPNEVASLTGTGRVASFFQLPTERVLVYRIAGMIKLWLWAVPGLLVLACIGAWHWRRNTLVRLLTAAVILTIGGYLLIWPDQGHGWGFRYFHQVWLALPLLGAAALARTPASGNVALTQDDNLRTYVVACALLSLALGTALRACQISNFMNEHLAQLPEAPSAGKRVMFIDTSYGFYDVDLVQNDPFLGGDEVRMISRDPEANASIMRKYFPGYRKIRAGENGEVWVETSGNPR